MRVSPFWIALPLPGRLGTMARPRGGEWLRDDLAALRSAGADVLVSLLTAAEADELDLGAEPTLAQACDLTFHRFPIPDYAVPPLNTDTVHFISDRDRVLLHRGPHDRTCPSTLYTAHG